MPITETIYNNAILKARNYGSKLGGEGRLITYDEASTIIDSSVELKSIILGDYAINKDERERGLIYWTSTTRNTNDNTVGIVCNTYKSGRTGSSIFVEENSEYDLDGSRHNQYPGVRPVVEMPKSALQ